MINSNEGVNPQIKISYPEIKEFFRNPARLNIDASRAMIQQIFKKDINDFLGKGNENHRSLVESMYTMALDPGLIRPQEFNGEMIEGVSMLNRQSLLFELRKRVGFKEKDSGLDYKVDKQFKILKLDLENFRKADELGSGDWNLNVFAGSLNKIIKKTAEELDINPENLLVGRYGGDEFCIGVIDDEISKTFKKLSLIKKNLIGGISEIEGYFSNSKIKDKFAIKNNEIEEVSAPEESDVNGRLIYYSFLQRGLVLDSDQIEIEKAYFKESGISLPEYLSETLARNIYPKEIFKNQEDETLTKINYLIKIHPELKAPFFLAQVLEDKDPGKGRFEEMLKFIENYLVDPLLDEVVLSRFDMVDHIKKGEFASIFTYEIKLKEIDDQLSYVYGDEVIIEFWKKNLKNDFMIKAIEEGKVRIGRVGGAIMVAETKQADGTGSLSKEEKTLLKENFKQIEVNFKGQNVKHNIGFSEVILKKDKYTNQEARIKFSECFIKSTDNWFIKTFNQLFIQDKMHKSEYKHFKELLAADNKEDDKNEANKQLLIIARYFTGKRWDKRRINARRVLEENKTSQNWPSKKVSEIIHLLELVKNRKLSEE